MSKEIIHAILKELGGGASLQMLAKQVELRVPLKNKKLSKEYAYSALMRMRREGVVRNDSLEKDYWQLTGKEVPRRRYSPNQIPIAQLKPMKNCNCNPSVSDKGICLHCYGRKYPYP